MSTTHMSPVKPGSKYVTSKSSYDLYGKSHPSERVTGQPYATKTSGHLDHPKTKSSPIPRNAINRMGFDGHSMKNVTRPSHQRADTVSGATLGKMSTWQTRGDNKKKALNSAYSMNQVAMARIMRENVHANEGAYLKKHLVKR